MRIAHGPRGQSGVTSIMGLGDDVEIMTPPIVTVAQQNHRLQTLDQFTSAGVKIGAVSWIALRLLGARSVAKTVGVGTVTLFLFREMAKRFRAM